MSVRSCRITIQDIEGVSHTLEVTAAVLYEAVAQGLAVIRGNEWVAGIAHGFNAVKVSVADVRVEHEVKLGNFTKWLEKAGGSPRDVSQRQRIRSILGHASVTIESNSLFRQLFLSGSLAASRKI